MAGARYTPIEAKVLEQFLQEKGFRRTVSGSEIVYVREHTYSAAVRVKVWTSIRVGSETVRESGRDAIRVTAAYEGAHPIRPNYKKPPSKSFGIYKAQRVFRTGGEEAILDRLYDRMRDAYGHCNEWVRNHWRDLQIAGATRQPVPPQPPTQPTTPQRKVNR